MAMNSAVELNDDVEVFLNNDVGDPVHHKPIVCVPLSRPKTAASRRWARLRNAVHTTRKWKQTVATKSLTKEEEQFLKSMTTTTTTTTDQTDEEPDEEGIEEELDDFRIFDDDDDAALQGGLKSSLRSRNPSRRLSRNRRSSLHVSLRGSQHLLSAAESQFLENIAAAAVPETYVEKVTQALLEDPSLSSEFRAVHDDEYEFTLEQSCPRRLSRRASLRLLQQEIQQPKQSEPSTTAPSTWKATLLRQLWNDYTPGSYYWAREKQVVAAAPVMTHTETPNIVTTKKSYSASKLLGRVFGSTAASRFNMTTKTPLYSSNNTVDDNPADDADDNDLVFTILGVASVVPGSTVLTPPLMDALRVHLPHASDNFWLKYSLLTHGSSWRCVLPRICNSSRTVLALETTDGHVLGAFCSSPWWVRGAQYFGSGESFLFRLPCRRKAPCWQDALEHETEALQVFRWTGADDCVQRLQTIDGDLIVGGDGGALVIAADLLHGRTHASATFGSPPLVSGADQSSSSSSSSSSELFEIANIEVWTLTPVDDLQQAETLELGRRFIFDNTNFVEV